jgi:hypothetical protein
LQTLQTTLAALDFVEHLLPRRHVTFELIKPLVNISGAFDLMSDCAWRCRSPRQTG